MTPQELAAQYLEYFETFTRDSNPNRTLYKTRDDRPEELHELIYEAHGDMLPDDWRYRFIYDALTAISECESDDLNDVELEPDIYTYEYLDWISSRNSRMGYCDDYLIEFGELKVEEGYTDKLITNGQWMEKMEVFYIVKNRLEQLAEELTEEEGEDEDE